MLEKAIEAPDCLLGSFALFLSQFSLLCCSQGARSGRRCMTIRCTAIRDLCGTGHAAQGVQCTALLPGAMIESTATGAPSSQAPIELSRVAYCIRRSRSNTPRSAATRTSSNCFEECGGHKYGRALPQKYGSSSGRYGWVPRHY